VVFRVGGRNVRLMLVPLTYLSHASTYMYTVVGYLRLQKKCLAYSISRQQVIQCKQYSENGCENVAETSTCMHCAAPVVNYTVENTRPAGVSRDDYSL